MNKYICVHGHFYQPPRENPWLEQVEVQDSAYPYHDWNERITTECYAPNAASRILDGGNRIIDIVNNYAKMSFNFGPSLLCWMEKHNPDTYAMILEADKLSLKNFSGHGAAIAQVYNHMIMPLANSRDKRTQVIWGIKDFVYRFKRQPEGMWLAEAAVDLETLDILAEFGIKFTILSPYQAQRKRKIGEDKWLDALNGKIDPKKPYLCKLPSGRTIAVFFYDGPVSQEIAFGGLLNNGEKFALRLLGLFSERQKESQLVHIATDGETYGHHHSYGEMALSYAYYFIENNNLAKFTIYAQYLEKFPPEYEVEIVENSSWSCSHGVDRWKSDCGCSSGMNPEWNQKWRAPLRKAMDWLRDKLVTVYEEQMRAIYPKPWELRNEYIDVILNRSSDNIAAFFNKHFDSALNARKKVEILELLEMQRHTMLMYTSCGWFFDEISGIETVQIMQYAARAIQIAKKVAGIDVDLDFLKLLKKAPSNVFIYKNGAKIYEKFIRPSVLDLKRVAAHYAISSLFKQYAKQSRIYCYSAEAENCEYFEAGRQKIVIGKTLVKSNITQTEDLVSFAAVHMGDHNLLGGVRHYDNAELFEEMERQIKTAFQKGDVSEIIRLIDYHFGNSNYSLWHLFKDEQRKVLQQILKTPLEGIKNTFRQINEQHYQTMQAVKEMGIPLPKVFSVTLEFILNADMRNVLEKEKADISKLSVYVKEVRRWSFELDKPALAFAATRRLTSFMELLKQKPLDTEAIKLINNMFRILRPLSLHLSIWKSQNIYFSIGKKWYSSMCEKANAKDYQAMRWVKNFRILGRYLRVRSG
ncbi:MAG: glycoside hydrolase [Candidatus Omnitrophota bacterium]|nr:MAG: glycoside hydrolase [Candidatus Omnitrophota bacterium]